MPDERSRTIWERLEPIARDEDMQGTLRGELADPLWLLTRQRQFGEFAGEDAGSPVEVALEYEQDRVNRVGVGESVDPYDPAADPPLETLVEREPVAAEVGNYYDVIRTEHGMAFLEPLREAVEDDPTAPNHAIRAEAGMHFLDRFRRAYHDDYPSAPLPTPSWFEPALFLTRPPAADGPARRFADVFDGEAADEPSRGLDGHLLYAALRVAVPGIADPSSTTDWSAVSDPVDFPFVDDVPGVDDDTVEPVARDALFVGVAEGFVEWYRNLYDEPVGAEDAWDPDRLEYAAAVSAGEGTVETTFTAEEYEGGRLDWYDFAASDGTLTLTDDQDGDGGGGAGAGGPETLDSLPTKANFQGMPASRLWELEDANVDLASVSAAGDDLARLFLLEFALIAGDDWFSIPIEAPVGSVTRVTDLDVRDTFGVTTESVDATANRSDATGWDLFTFDLPGATEPGLFLPPVLGTSGTGEVVEAVRFGRDEMANLVFGIETTVEGTLGDPLDRTEFRGPSLSLGELQPAPTDLSGAAAAREESVELSNPGDDDLEVDGWELRVEDAETGADTTVGLPTLTIPAEGSIRVVTGTGVDTEEAVHLDLSDPLLSADAIVSVRKPTDDGMGLVTLEAVEPERVEGLPAYRLATEVEDHWFPYLPANTGLPQRFELGLLLDADALAGTLDMVPEPMGRVLDPTASIYAEEISRTGRVVERYFQASAWLDGRSHVWSTREVGPGTGEVSSGLRFDFLEDGWED